MYCLKPNLGCEDNVNLIFLKSDIFFLKVLKDLNILLLGDSFVFSHLNHGDNVTILVGLLLMCTEYIMSNIVEYYTNVKRFIGLKWRKLHATCLHHKILKVSSPPYPYNKVTFRTHEFTKKQR